MGLISKATICCFLFFALQLWIIGGIYIYIWVDDVVSTNDYCTISNLIIAVGVIAVILGFCCSAMSFHYHKLILQIKEKDPAAIGVVLFVIFSWIAMFILCMMSLPDVWGINGSKIDDCTTQSWNKYAITISWTIIMLCVLCSCIGPTILYCLYAKTSLFVPHTFVNDNFVFERAAKKAQISKSGHFVGGSFGAADTDDDNIFFNIRTPNPSLAQQYQSNATQHNKSKSNYEGESKSDLDAPEDVANKYQSIAYNASEEGRLILAEESYLVALEEIKRVYGEYHPQTAICKHHIGLNYAREGRITKAVSCYHESIHVFQECMRNEAKWYTEYIRQYLYVCSDLHRAYKVSGDAFRASNVLIDVVTMHMMDPLNTDYFNEQFGFKQDEEQLMQILNEKDQTQVQGLCTRMEKEEAAAALPWNNIAVTLLVIIFIGFLMLIWMDKRLWWSQDRDIKSHLYKLTVAILIFIFSMIVLIHSLNRARFHHQAEHKYAVRFEIEMANKLCFGCIQGKYHCWSKNACIMFCILYDFITLVAYSFLIALQWMQNDDVLSHDRLMLYTETILMQFSWDIFLLQFGFMFLLHVICILFVMVHNKNKENLNTKRINGYDLFRVHETEKHSQQYWKYTKKWKISKDTNTIRELDADAKTPLPFKGLFGLTVFVLLWCPSFRNALLLFHCNDDNLLLLHPDIECWTSSTHCVLITLAMISIFIQILLGYEYALKYRNAQFPAFTFISGYNVILFTFKIIMCLLVSLFCRNYLMLILVLLMISLIMLICSVTWQPFIGVAAYLNNLNTTFYAASIWCWLSVLYTAIYPNSNMFVGINISYLDTFIGLPIICIAVSYLNNYRAKQYVIPSTTYDSLKWYFTKCAQYKTTDILQKKTEVDNNFKHSHCLHEYAMYLLRQNDISQCDMFLWYAQETSLFAMMISKNIEVIVAENEEEMKLRHWLAQLISDVGFFYQTCLKDHESAKSEYQRAFELCPYHVENLKRYVSILAYFQAGLSNVGYCAIKTLYEEISESQIWSHCIRPSDLAQILEKTRVPHYLVAQQTNYSKFKSIAGDLDYV